MREKNRKLFFFNGGVIMDYKFLSAVWTLILMAPIHCRGSISEQMM